MKRRLAVLLGLGYVFLSDHYVARGVRKKLGRLGWMLINELIDRLNDALAIR